MKVILKSDIDNLGSEGEVIEVKKGYARNYLIPRDLAVLATSGSLKQLDSRKKALEKKEAEKRKGAEEVAKKIDGAKVKIMAKSGKENLYGKVTSKIIAEALAEQNKIEVDKRKIDLKDDIKKIGSYPVTVKIYPEVEAKITVIVAEEKKDSKKKSENAKTAATKKSK